MKQSNNVCLRMIFEKFVHGEIIGDEMLLKLCWIVDGFKVENTDVGLYESVEAIEYLIH